MCISPILIKQYRKDEALIARELQRNPKTNHPHVFYGYVPCGKCYSCLAYLRLQYQFRLFEEAANSMASFFVTYTYADEYLPADGVNKEYLKKMQRYLKNDVGLKFTYYGIGEYGTDNDATHRPHYHVMYFFKEQYDIDMLLRVFVQAHSLRKNINGKYEYESLGFVTVGEITAARVGYITHYHVRPKEPPTCQYKNKTFQILSKGIGSQLFNDSKVLDFIQKSPDWSIHNMKGDKIPLPYYYRRKYKIYKDVKQAQKNPFIPDEFLDYYNSLDFWQQFKFRDGLKLKDKRKLDNYNHQYKLNYL